MDYMVDENQLITDFFPQLTRPYILFLGRLNAIKGPDLLIDAYANITAQCPGVDLVFAGPDDGMRAQLISKAHCLRLDSQVHFVGSVYANIKAKLLRSAMLLAIPSRQEAMSIVVLEAGACETPVLISDQCGFNEIDEIHGGVICRAEVDDIACKLSQILSAKDSLPTMAAALNQFVVAHYQWDEVAKKLSTMHGSCYE